MGEVALDEKFAFLKNKNFWAGFCISFFAIIGICASISWLWGRTYNILSGAKQKARLESFIEPILMCDPFPFSEGSNISNSLLLQAALNNIFLNSNKEYPKSEDNEYIIPQSDIEVSASELFGPNIKLTHGNLRDLSDFYCNYHENEQAYYIQYSTQASNYFPKVTKITKEEDYLNLTVGYIRPQHFLSKTKRADVEPDKYMIYKLKKNKTRYGYQIVAIKEDSV